MKRIFLVTNYNGHMPQLTHETNSLDLVLLTKLLEKEFLVQVITLDALAESMLNNSVNYRGSFFFFASSQIESYKMAILDVAFEVKALGGILLPKFEFYLSHENKFHQELYKNRKQVSTPKATLITNSNNIPPVNVPAVVKGYAGFGSRGVTLVKNAKQLNRTVLSNLKSYVIDKLDLMEILKSFIKSKFKYPGLYPSKTGRVVVQDFMPNLKHDWKVLVFGNDVFALKRYVKKNDFRASGSGFFDFDERPSDELIKFAVDTRCKLDTPFVSLDIAELEEKKFNIIEYQSVHFGLITALNCNNYYTLSSNVVSEKNTNIDSVIPFFANSIIEYVKERGGV